MTPLRLARSASIAFLAAACLLPIAPVPAGAAAPTAKTAAPLYYRVKIGDIDVTAVGDGTVDLPVNQLLKEPAAQVDKALARSFLKNPLETSVNAYLVNTGAKLILIDAGAGTLFGPTLGKLLANLKAAGYAPEQVDAIAITHFHPDHVGGLAADGAAAFPNATLQADRLESDFWLSQANLDRAPDASKDFYRGAMASVGPYVKAGRYQPFDGATELAPGVRALPSHGHTAGHTSYVIESKGEKLIVLGDLIHVGAVQFDKPKVTITFDSDPKAAAAARELVFSRAAAEGTLVAGAHLPFPGIGHLRKVGARYEWLPVNFTQPR